jgi:hypothetical protein
MPIVRITETEKIAETAGGNKISIAEAVNLFRTKDEELHRESYGEYKKFKPAEQSAVDGFAENARKKGIPEKVIGQLTEFYKIADNMWVEGAHMHPCDDLILFEWWDGEDHEHEELWLGGCDFNIFRWSKEKDKFCMGDAGDASYDEDHEFDTLAELLEFIFNYFFIELAWGITRE